MSWTGNQERTLKIPEEVRLAESVFGKSLPPYDKMYITDGIGVGQRPWTERVSPIRSVLGTGSGSGGYWRMHLGRAGFISIMNMQATLIHELTHVWQGYHSVLGGSYMIKAVVAQTLGSGYSYVSGKDWNDYNVEQKAQIVEDWFSNGMKYNDPRYTYIMRIQS